MHTKQTADSKTLEAKCQMYFNHQQSAVQLSLHTVCKNKQNTKKTKQKKPRTTETQEGREGGREGWCDVVSLQCTAYFGVYNWVTSRQNR